MDETKSNRDRWTDAIFIFLSFSVFATAVHLIRPNKFSNMSMWVDRAMLGRIDIDDAVTSPHNSTT